MLTQKEKDFYHHIMTIFLSDEEITRIMNDQGHIMEINIENNLIARILAQDLVELISFLPSIPVDIFLRNNESENWIKLSQHEDFQTLFIADDEQSSEKIIETNHYKFHLLIHGHKQGPYSFEEIKKRLLLKEISYTETVSIDNGYNWISLYEIPILDRRAKGRPLPKIPKKHLFLIKEKDSERFLRKENEKFTILSSLAALRHKDSRELSREIFTQKDLYKRSRWLVLFASLLTMTCLIFYYLMFLPISFY